MGFIDMEDKGNKGSSISKGSSKIIEISCPICQTLLRSSQRHIKVTKYGGAIDREGRDV